MLRNTLPIFLVTQNALNSKPFGKFVSVQGKTGKMEKVIPDREKTGNLKILEKHSEFENLKREMQHQENNSRNVYA